MRKNGITWKRAILGALAAEIGQVAAAFVWVAIYSFVIDPGQPMRVYEAHAQASGPWVSILAGGAIFYAASRWVASDTRTALALFGIFVVVDLAIMMGMTAPGTSLSNELFGMFALSYVSKALLCYLGGKHAEARSAQH